MIIKERCYYAPAHMTSRTIRNLRWWMIGLLMAGSIINYLTRSTLSVAAPTVLKDLDTFVFAETPVVDEDPYTYQNKGEPVEHVIV